VTIEVTDIQEAVHALSEAVAPEHGAVAIMKILAWPVVVAWGLFAFRVPLSRFIRDLGGRITKFSAFHVEVELAAITTPSLPLAELVVTGEDVTGGPVMPTTITELLKRIRDDASPCYLLVDIGEGKRWLISRLFLFTLVLWRIGAIRCVVFVDSIPFYARRFLGIAEPERVCKALGLKYSQFSDARDASWVAVREALTSDTTLWSRAAAETFVQKFIMDARIQSPNAPASPDEWEALGPPGQQVWEHTKWLTKTRFNQDLREVLYDLEESRLVDSPDTPIDRRNQGLLRRSVPFVALVNSRGEMKYLVERYKFLQQVATHLASAHDAQRSARERLDGSGDGPSPENT
jgi:hypothetical protein